MSRRPVQIKFKVFEKRKDQNEHGGSINRGKRKVARPFNPKLPIHLNLRSTEAKREKSFLRPAHKALIQKLIKALSTEWSVSIYEFAINGNHLHLLVRTKQKKNLQNFLRVLAGQIAMKVGGRKKGSRHNRKFWDQLAYTRLVSWGREFLTVKKYIFQNFLEASGVFSRKDPLAKYGLEDWWRSLRETPFNSPSVKGQPP
jgi:REP element-mobilizing transposase RayT